MSDAVIVVITVVTVFMFMVVIVIVVSRLVRLDVYGASLSVLQVVGKRYVEAELAGAGNDGRIASELSWFADLDRPQSTLAEWLLRATQSTGETWNIAKRSAVKRAAMVGESG
jgi:hypothetical protein